MTVVPLTQREFELYALSLPRGPNFGPLVVRSAWKAENANSIGVVLVRFERRYCRLSERYSNRRKPSL
jgi:hypothetical protein